jgi:hypothetical protein
MKRINPQTGNPFHLGDKREDGRLFYGYTNRIKRTGFFVEIWINPDSHHIIKLKDLARKKKKYDSTVFVPN